MTQLPQRVHTSRRFHHPVTAVRPGNKVLTPEPLQTFLIQRMAKSYDATHTHTMMPVIRKTGDIQGLVRMGLNWNPQMLVVGK